MTRKEAASCINTIVILKNLCYRVRGLMDVIDAQNCDKIIEMLNMLIQGAPWVPCSKRLPECEQEVLICTKKKVVGKNAYIDSIITPALYEDGTMLEIDSKWSWEDIDYDKWDEENDCGIIPEGWWENRHFNPDDVYNNVVDREVVAWMQLPEPYQGEGE